MRCLRSTCFFNLKTLCPEGKDSEYLSTFRQVGTDRESCDSKLDHWMLFFFFLIIIIFYFSPFLNLIVALLPYYKHSFASNEVMTKVTIPHISTQYAPKFASQTGDKERCFG